MSPSLIFGLLVVNALLGLGACRDFVFRIKLQKSKLIEASSPGDETLSGSVYAVVVDAGSSGSRVVAYEFEKQGDSLKLIREEFHKIKPGLSSYADDPKEGAKKIIDLIHQVDDFVPDEEKPNTRLFLRATAGLRLLGEEVAQTLLDEVQKEFEKTAYKVDKNAAGLLSGSDEGLFAWFTVNYLKGALDSKTFAALEMGGGSAQVTYEPKEKYTWALKNDIHPVPYKDLRVFSKSYLGLGLNAARDTMFQADSRTEIKEGQEVFSRCLHPDIKGQEFTYNNKKYFISGKPDSGRRTRAKIYTCRYHVMSKLLPLVKPRPLGLSDEASVALSAFYYRGDAAQLIASPSGKTTVGGIWERAEKECSIANQDDPFLCMDLIYIYTLLKDGYGLRDKNDIEMILKIDDHELSWALGFAYSQLIKQ